MAAPGRRTYSLAIFYHLDHDDSKQFYIASKSEDPRLPALLDEKVFDVRFRRRILLLKLGEDSTDQRYHLFLRVEECKYSNFTVCSSYAI
jgi:hypothetical protein